MYDNSIGWRSALRQVQRTFDLRGRSTRSELVSYWLFGILLNFAIAIPFLVLLGFDQMRGAFGIALSSLWIIPLPALIVRRLHDRNWTGWYGLLLFLPLAFDRLVGVKLAIAEPLAILLAVVSGALFVPLLLDPTNGPNRFGPDPRLDPATNALGQT